MTVPLSRAALEAAGCPTLAILHIEGWKLHAAAAIEDARKALATAGRVRLEPEEHEPGAGAAALGRAARHRDTAGRYLRACRLHAAGLDLSATLAAAKLADSSRVA